VAERPSVPHHLVGQKATGPRARVVTQPPHDPRELPAARPTGDVAAMPTISAAMANLGIDPSLLAAFDLLQRNLKAEINLGMNGAVGAQDSVELTLERRKVKTLESQADELAKTAQKRLVTAIVSLCASLAILGVTWLVVKAARDLFREDVPAAVAEAVETKADPIERRVASTETQVDELAGDVADVGRKVDALARAVSQLAAALEEDEPPAVRRRTR
jgi:hypothetical protein